MIMQFMDFKILKALGMCLRLADGMVTLFSHLPSTGVYMNDLEMFSDIVTGQRDGSNERWLCIRGLELADQLNMMAKTNNKSVNYR